MTPEDYVLKFEAVKTSFRQTRDGYHLTLVLHPNDVPNELYTSWVGTRYQCVMVELNDEDKPVEREGVEEGRRAVATAAQLCRSDKFQIFIGQLCPKPGDKLLPPYDLTTEDATAARLRHLCGVESRGEFADNELARVELEKLKQRFLDALRASARGIR
tara:strand:- start:4161 stop:4637 length:477 start_codon:yes stop_codon:yes gene_type:complete